MNESTAYKNVICGSLKILNDFGKEIKINSSKHSALPTRIGNACGALEITNLWKEFKKKNATVCTKTYKQELLDQTISVFKYGSPDVSFDSPLYVKDINE